MNTCFFCNAEGYRGYECEGEPRLWLCQSHWRLVGEFIVEEFEEEGLISLIREVTWQDD